MKAKEEGVSVTYKDGVRFTVEQLVDLLKPLDSRARNYRLLKEQTVLKYLSDMERGHAYHDETGETVKRDAKGNLVDGQHRLEAELRWQRAGGAAHRFDVADGVTKRARHVIDTGLRRSLSDHAQSLQLQNST